MSPLKKTTAKAVAKATAKITAKRASSKKSTARSPVKKVQSLKRQVLVAERMRFELLKKKQTPSSGINFNTFAAGVAHEFNNILGAADGHAEWALDSGRLEDMREALGIIRQACVRSSQITKALQGLFQPFEEHKELFDLKIVGQELVKMLKPLCEQNQIELQLQLDSMQIYGSQNRVLEIFINLVKNSVEAFQGYKSSAPKIIIISSRFSKKEVIINIRDSGPGVADIYKESVFDAFFTTKGVLKNLNASASPGSAASNGSGLGLFLCRQIAQEHAGSLNLSPSTSQAGACFELRLPRV